MELGGSLDGTLLFDRDSYLASFLFSASSRFMPKTARALSACGSCLTCLEWNLPSVFLPFRVLFSLLLLLIFLNLPYPVHDLCPLILSSFAQKYNGKGFRWKTRSFCFKRVFTS
jgi:hypothetical protein